MERVKNWDVELYRLTTAAVLKQHAWGDHDCLTFAADCVVVITGEDLANDVRSQYDSAYSAAKLIKENGFEDFGDMVASRLPEIEVGAAMRGDVVLNDGPEGEFLGVVDGQVSVAPGAEGLLQVPLAQAKRAFKVG